MDHIAALFSLLCHQLPERSPHWHGESFALCWRCSGLYFGVLSSYLYIVSTGGFKRRMPTIPGLIAASVVMTPFLIDGWANTLGLWDTPGWLRAVTGLGYGVVLPLLLVPLACAQPFDPALKPTLPRAGALLLPLGIGALLLLALDEPASHAVFDAMAVFALLALTIFATNFVLTLRGRFCAKGWLASPPGADRSTGRT